MKIYSNFRLSLLTTVLLCCLTYTTGRAECSKPTDLSVANINSTSATLLWSLPDIDVLDRMEYDYVVSTIVLENNPNEPYNTWWRSVDENTEGVALYGSKVELDIPRLLMQGLEPNTEYYILLRQNCEWNYDRYSEWVSFSFRTMCSPAILPMDTMKFEGTQLDECWYSSGDVKLQNTYRYGNTGYAVCLNSTAETPALLYTPALQGSSAETELIFRIYSTSKQKYMVGLASLTNGLGSQVQVVLQDSTVKDTWTEVVISEANNRCPDGYMWVIYADAGNPATFYVDNVWIHEKPDCVRPSGLKVTELTATAATLSWTENGDATQWILSLTPEDGEEQFITANTNPFVCESLQPNTKYTVKVKSACSGGGESEYASVAVTFHTLCQPTLLPIVEDFSFAELGKTYSVPDCWTVLASNSGCYAEVVNPSYNVMSGGYMILHTNGGREEQVIVALPQVEEDINTLRLDFTPKFYYSSQSTTNGELFVGYLTNPTDASSFVPVQQIPYDGSKTIRYYVDLLSASTDAKVVAFLWGHAEYNSDYYVYIDDINLQVLPTCVRPNEPELGEVEAEGVEFILSSTDTEVTKWEVVYKIGSEDETVQVIQGNSFVMPVEPATTYSSIQLSIRAICAVGDTSEVISKTFSFTTPCVSYEVPFEESFENTTERPIANDAIPNCWERESNKTSSYYHWRYYDSSSYQSYDGSGCLHVYGDGYINTLKTPVINLTEDASLFFKCKVPQNAGLMDVGVYDVDEDEEHLLFVSIKTDEWNLYSTDLSQYTGHKIQVFFRAYTTANYYYIFLDDVKIGKNDECLPPAEVWVENVTSTTALLKVRNAVTSIEVEYGETDITEHSVTAQVVSDTTQVLLTDLEPSTNYQLHVRSVCADGETSAWGTIWNEQPIKFSTSQVTVSLPYQTDFSGDEETGDTKWVFVNGDLTNHWTIGTYSSDTTALYIAKDQDDTPGYNNTNQTLVWATKAFTVASAGIHIVSFDWVAVGESSYDYINAFIMPSDVELVASGSQTGSHSSGYPNVADGWIRLGGNLLNQKSEIQHVEEEHLLSGGDYQIVFLWRNDGSGGTEKPAPAIFNVSISRILCDVPDNLHVAQLSDTSAELSWLGMGNSYNILLYTEPAHTEQTEPVQSIEGHTDMSITLTDLTPNTTYYAMVQAVCDGGDSKWTEQVEFRTACSPQTLPYTDGIEIGETAFPDCWSFNTTSPATAKYQPTTTYKHSGERSFQCANVTLTSMLLDYTDDTDLSDYIFSFFALALDNDQSLEVSIVTESEQEEPIYNTSISANGEWQEVIVSFADLKGVDHDILKLFKYIRLNFNSPTGSTCIDDLRLEVLPACPKPSSVKVDEDNITASSVKLDWQVNGTETEWQVIIYKDEQQVVSQVVSEHPCVIEGLEELTNYSVGVRAICGEGDTSVVSLTTDFFTMQIPVALPYEADFTSDETAKWWLINGDEVNYWQVGLYNDTAALAITNGTTQAIGSYDKSQKSIVWAIKTFIVEEAGSYNIGFGWQSGGESSMYDYMCAFIAPEDAVVTAGNQNVNGTNVSYSATPAGWVRIGESKFNLSTGREVYAEELILSAGKHKLVLLWNNDSSGGDEKAIVIDSLSISKTVCGKPELELGVIGGDEASVILPYETEQSQIEYVLSKQNAIPDEQDVVSTQGNELHFSGLDGRTNYYLYVRVICDDNLRSLWNSISFKTGYSLPFSEDFNNWGSNSVPTDWDNSETDNPSIKWVSFNGNPISTSFGYDKVGMCFNSGTNPKGNTATLKTPSITIRHEATLSFMYKRPETLGRMDVYVSTDGGNTIAGTLVDSIPAAADWTAYSCDLSDYKNQNVVIMFKGTSNEMGNSTGNGYILLDNVEIEACIPPTEIILEEVTATTARLKMVGGCGELEVNYGEDLFIQVSATADTTEVELTDLLPSTTYTVKVRSVCDGDFYGRWSNVSLEFQTNCVAFEIPFIEDFNTIGSGIPNCWNNDEGTTTNNSYKWSSANETNKSYDGSRYMVFDSYTNTQGLTNFLKTPVINLTENARLSFMCKKPEYAGQMDVYISYESDTLVVDTLFEALSAADWIRFTYDLTAYTGKEVTIIFKGTSSFGNNDAYMYIDDVIVESVDACQSPVDLLLGDYTATTAIVSVVGAMGNVYVEYGEISILVPVEGDTTNVLLDNLQQCTSYLVRARSVCAEGDSSRWLAKTLQFTTPQLPVYLPYTADFSSSEVEHSWNFINGTLTNHWEIGTYNDNPALYITNGTPGNYTNNATCNAVWATKRFTVTKDWKYNVSFDWLCNGEGSSYSNYDYFCAFIAPASAVLTANSASVGGISLSDSNTPSGWIRLGAKAFNQKTDRQNYEQDVDLTAGDYQFVFFWRNDAGGGSNPAAVIYSLAVDEVHCVLPETAVSITNRQSNGCTINIDTDLEDGSSIEYVYAEQTGSTFNPDALVSSLQTSETNIITISDMEAGKRYNIAVRLRCAEDEVTGWIVRQVRISCVTEMPFVETFNDITSGVPQCWDDQDGDFTTSYRWESYDQGYDNTRGMRFWDYSSFGNTYHYQSLITPAITLTEDASLSFMSYMSASPRLDIYLSEDGGATMIDTLANNLSVSNAWSLYEYDLSEHTGKTVNVVFKATGRASSYTTSYLYLDSVRVGAQVKPTKLQVANITDVSATASWNMPAGAIGYEYKLVGGEDQRVVSAATTERTVEVELDNLSAQTKYALTVCAVFADNDSSVWVGPVSFTTKCAVLSVPYSEPFNENVFAGDCWERYSGKFNGDLSINDLTEVSSGWIHDTGVNYDDDDDHIRVNIFGTTVNHWAISPSLELDENNYWLMFDLALTQWNTNNPVEEGKQADDRFIVAVSEDNGQTWSLDNAWEWNNTGSARVFDKIPAQAEMVVLPLDNYAGKTIRVAFYGESTVTGGDNNLKIDNLRINDLVEVNYKDTICAHSSYRDEHFQFTANDLVLGVENHFSKYVDSVGILYSLDLYVYPDGYVEIYDTICSAMPYNKYGLNIEHPQTRTYYTPEATLFTAAGCDSVVTLHLFVPETEYTEYLTLCQTDLPYQFGSQSLSASGEYVEAFPGTYCDSIVTLYLTVIPAATEYSQTICRNDSIFFGGEYVKEPGNYDMHLTNILGCDSLVTLHLTVIEPVYYDYQAIFCQGSVYEDNNFSGLTAAGLYVDTLVAASGCDSIVRLTLVEDIIQNITLEETICSGESYVFDGMTFTTSTQHTAHFTNVNGCDSVVTLHLTVLPTMETDMSLTLTSEQFPYLFAQTTDSMYVIEDYVEGVQWLDIEIVGGAENGCDSIVHLTLTVNIVDALGNVAANVVRIMPNVIPVGSTTILYNDFAVDKELTVEIYSSTGQCVNSRKVAGEQIVLDGFNSAGLYLVKLHDEQNRNYIGRVIVK